MSSSRLHLAGKPVTLHAAVDTPQFRLSRVLCSDPWDYVYLWLRRHHQSEAQFYWEQGKHFFHASKALPDLSSPLTSYYCFLNATKALLVSKGKSTKDVHGVAGETGDGRVSLHNEFVEFYGSGVLPTFCKYFAEPDNAGSKFDLYNLLWRMPFIHRAFTLTYKGCTELFLPLNNCGFVRKDGSQEAWFQAELAPRYVNAHTKRLIEPGFELFKESDGRYVIRRKRRFKWHGHDLDGSLESFTKYHRQIRRRIFPIYAPENRWYLMKAVEGYDRIKNSPLILMFAAMHKLSELSRYNPIAFSRHLGASHNWLISEFLRVAPTQFVYGVASEITGMEFLAPDAFQSGAV